MLPALLVLAVAVGIAWPLFFRHKALVQKTAPTPAPAGGPTPVGVGHAEELCPYCARLNPPGREVCVECGQKMPVERIGSLFEGSEKQALIREGVQCGILFVAMLIAMVLSYNLPVTGKLVVLLITICALAWRFLRAIYSE
jgi:hypothetical protein